MDLATRSIRLHPSRDSSSAVSFAWRHIPGTPWHELFSGLDWLIPELLSRVDGESCRRVPEMRADRWVHRRIALIGGAELLGDALDIFPTQTRL